MMIKITGAEFWSAWNDEQVWGMHEDAVVRVNGEMLMAIKKELIPDDAEVVFDGGIFYRDEEGDHCDDFETYLVNWRHHHIASQRGER